MAKGLDTMAALDADGLADLRGMVIAAQDELVRACGKHPKFPERLVSGSLGQTREQLDYIRAYNDSTFKHCPPTAKTVLAEEIWEMVEAAHKGDLRAAREECVQSMAMLLRIYVHLPEYCAQARGEAGRASPGSAGSEVIE